MFFGFFEKVSPFFNKTIPGIRARDVQCSAALTYPGWASVTSWAGGAEGHPA
jgi:hypothetical protein